MNPRRPNSNRPGGRRFGGGGGRSRGGYGGGGGRPRRGGGGKPADLPMLLGEPSPSLAKINAMNMEKLAAKIASLQEEQQRMQAKLDRLLARDPAAPEEKITQAKETLVRLKALEDAAAKRLAGKAERKAMREQRGR
ncbi:MAG: hypothetical protein AAF593_08320 [Planctomycetota bacterium]